MMFFTSTLQALATLAILVCLGGAALVFVERTLGKVPLTSPLPRLFAAMSVGIILAVLLFALVRTGGNSSQWALLLPIVALVWTWPTRGPEAVRGHHRARPALLFGGGAFLLSALWFAPRTMAAPDMLLRPLPRDDVFYVSVTEALLTRGVETTDALVAHLSGAPLQPKVYHYFELWLAACISWIWDVPPALALRFHADTILLVAVIMGLAALLSEVRGNSWKVLVAALWLPFVGWWLPAVLTESDLFRETRNWQAGLIMAGTPKLLPAYLFALAGALGLLRGWPGLAVSGAALASCANISFAPLLAGFGLGAILDLRRRGVDWLRELAPLALAGLAPLLVLTYFQMAGGSPATFAAAPLDGFGWRDLRVTANITIKSLFYCSLFLGAPAVLALGWVGVMERLKTLMARPFLAGSVGTGLVGLVIWATLHRWLDSVQFFMNPTIVAGNVALVVAFAIRPMDRRLGMIVSLGIVLSVTNWVSAVSAIGDPSGSDPAFLQKLRNEPPVAPRVGGLVIGREAALRRPLWELNPAIMSPGVLTGARCCVGAIPMVDLSGLVLHDAQLAHLWKESPFVRFALERSLDITTPDGLEGAQEQFVRFHKLRFVVVARDTPVPNWVTERFMRELSDPTTGVRVFFLDPPAE